MNKRGFTLVELLVVIAIISILSLLVIPSIVNINKNVDRRLYAQKVEYIISAAELYASNNPDIFQGSDTVEVPVYLLIEEGYLKKDENVSNCNKENTADCANGICDYGCVINPEDNSILNSRTVTVTKKSIGIVGEFDGTGGTSTISSSETLVKKVCDGFESGAFDGRNASGSCKCSKKNEKYILIDTSSSSETDFCMIVSNKASGEVDNWLRYGASEANWRVIGLYKVNGSVSAKMITSGVVK